MEKTDELWLLEAIAETKEKYPRIDATGIRDYNPSFDRPTPTEELLELGEEILYCRDWLDGICPAKEINWRNSTCTYTRLVRHSGKFVTIGAFIIAAIGMGFRCGSKPGRKNASFNISRSDVKRLWQEHRTKKDGVKVKTRHYFDNLHSEVNKTRR